MESAEKSYVVERIDVNGFEPDIVDGAQVGEFRGLELQGGLNVGMWRSDPATYDYPFETDEAFHVVAGAATIELLDSGETVVVREGDVAYFKAGTRSVWTITEPFKKFVVMCS